MIWPKSCSSFASIAEAVFLGIGRSPRRSPSAVSRGPRSASAVGRTCPTPGFVQGASRGFVHRHRHQRDEGRSRQLAAIEQERRITPLTSAITTSLTLTPKWFLTFLTSSRSSRAKATLRLRGETAVEPVRGAVNGAAIARPRAARRMVSTTALTVAGRTLTTSCSGRLANRARPPIAIRQRVGGRRSLDRVRWRRVGFGAAQLRKHVGDRSPRRPRRGGP